jgi:hypothetical protein
LEKEFENKNTVLCFFDKLISDLYIDNEKIFIINGANFTFCTSNQRKIINIVDFEVEHFTSEYSNIISDLKLYTPIILRWNSFGDDFELNLRKSANKIIAIANFLKEYQIKKCLISTGVYHHLDTLIIDLACRLCKIPRIYFYSNNISGRLIPMLQYGDITTRKPLNLNISQYDSTNNLLNFKNRALKNSPPLLGGQFLKTDIITFKKAIFKAIYYSIRSLYTNIKNICIQNKNIDNSFSTYPFQFIKQVINQKKALEFLYKNTTNEDLSKINVPKLLILAHYQPEATSFPEGHDLWNHIDIVYKINSLGYDQKIFYKEHFGNIIYSTEFGPSQVGSYRDIDYYKTLLKLNCVFIKDSEINKYGGPNCNLFLPITITGTVAVERALNGLHTIITGQPWYKGMPGVIHIEDIELINQLPKNYITRNEEVAEAAFNFLNNILINKTISNSFGIGIDGKFDKSKLDDFVKEINIIINANF